MKHPALGAGTVGAVLLALLSPATARAAGGAVSAGDRIHVGTAVCSLAYTYRSTTNGHTYAITAAHCQNGRSTTAHTDTGVVGTFVRAAVDPAGIGGSDFALLDFGPSATPGRYVGGRPLLYGLDRPEPGETICRSGATTGTHCGIVQAARGAMQYVTAPGMTPCAGGDSGGAVWAIRSNGAQIIGVWLGGVSMPDGTELGRFAVLADGFTALGLT